MSRPPETLVDLVELRANSHSARPIYTFLGDDGCAAPAFGALSARALRLAGAIQRMAEPGDRALLLFPFGEDCVVGLLGAILAGVVCVPLPASGRRGISFLPAARDSGARLVLTDLATRGRLRPEVEEPGLRWVCADDSSLEGAWTRPPTRPDDLAWLQYTSGSTGAPRGVRVLQRNAIANSADIGRAWGLGPDSRAVTWVPHYHDDGLVNGLLQPLYHGFRSALMDPLRFIASPERWLRAISAERATHAGGPNFTYEVTLRKVSPELRQGLDLSSWEMAYNAAEPVRADTLRRFFEAFRPCGLRWSTLRPAYGMAETTLLVTTSPSGQGPLLRRFDGPALREQGLGRPLEQGGDGHWLASSGRAVPGTRVAIWDARSGEALQDGQVGEILVQGPGVTDGYWQRPEVNAAQFGLELPGEAGRWLRTGDLGFLLQGELFVTGRQKDLIIVAGVNHYPQDIEAAVEAADPAFRPGCCAAFGVELPGEAEEGVVVAAEVKGARPGEAARLAEIAQRAIGATMGLRLHALVVLPPEHLPKTSSGKVRRQPTRAAWQGGGLQIIDQWQRGPAEAPRSPGAGLRAQVLAAVARVAGLPPEKIPVDREFAELGLRSLDAASIAASLSESLGRPLSTLALFQHPTVDRLVAHLSGEGAGLLAAPDRAAGEPIAIIGMACRFPGAPDLESYWRLVESGGHAITPVPEARWRLWEEWDPGIRHNPRLALRTGGFIEGLEDFDAAFFGISPREAPHVDPQQRLAMELCWEALQDAGIPPEELSGSATGIYAAALDQEHGRRIFAHGHEALITAWSGTGGALSILANRLSYLLDLHGPSLTVDTACSSSLTALHLAVQSLRSGESGMALVVATNLLLTPGATINFSEAGALSRSGHPRPFDARADGFVRAEGAGALLLKPLSRALADGDRVQAVIRGSALVQDGRTNGLMAPSGEAQQATLRAALADAGLPPGSLSHIECHGTGTPLGDPIEMEAIGAVHAPHREAPLLLGSAKANLGHLEAAAGMAGLIKAALSLARRTLPPVAGLQQTNPAVDLSALRLEAPREARPWTGPRLAGVSSFGFGGTNAHVILEAAPDLDPQDGDLGAGGRAPRNAPPTPPAAAGEGPLHLLPLSARSAPALQELVRRWAERLGSGGDLPPLLATAALGRSQLPWRLCALGADAEDLRQSLLQARPQAAPPTGERIWLLSGHGSQHAGMHQGPPLRAWEQGLAAALESLRAEGCELPWPLCEEQLDSVALVQPAIFAVQMALGTAMEALGLRPAAILGQSMGEVAAAALAGALSLRDAARVITLRSRLLARTEGQGAMLVLPLSAAEAARRLSPGLVVAVRSAPQSVVVAGPCAEIDALEQRLTGEGLSTRRVRTRVAFHSPAALPLQEELRRGLSDLRPRPAQVPLWSTVTGQRIRGDELGPDYWARNLAEPVCFAEALADLQASLGPGLPALELSPHPLLSGAARQGGCPSFVAGLSRERPAIGLLAELFLQGHSLRWSALHPQRRRVPAPLYPWQRERHWLELPRRAGSGHALLGRPPRLAPGERRRWHSDLEPLAWLREHSLGGQALMPAAALVEAVRAAGAEALGAPMDIEGLELLAPWFPDGCGWELRLELEGEDRGARFTAASPEGPVATGSLRPAAPPPGAPPAAGEAALDAAAFHEDFEARGLLLGPAFRAVRSLRVAEGVAEAELEPPPGLPNLEGALLHPALLDAALRVAAAGLPLGEGVWAPVRISRLCALRPLRGPARVLSRARRADGAALADLWISTPTGEPIAAILGLEVRRIAAQPAEQRCAALAWEALPAEPAPPAAASLLGELPASLLEALRPDPDATLILDARPLAWGSEELGPLSQALSTLVQDVARMEGGRRALLLPPGLAGAALAGALRAARRERPDLQLQALHLGAEPDPALLCNALASAEPELRSTQGQLQVRRLHPIQPRGRRPELGQGLIAISGGLGALGLQAAELLVQQGARSIMLIGRRPPRPELQPRLEALRAAGAQVELALLDVSEEEPLRAALAGRRLQGVIHAAGLVDDAPLAAHSAERVWGVLRPKVQGARVLSRLAPAADFFLLYGSVAGVWGNAGQAAYAAANAALEAIAEERRAVGQAALCIGWGPWSGEGMAAEQGALERAEAMGLGAISPEEGRGLLLRLLGCGGPDLAVAPVDWARFAGDEPLFSRLRPEAPPTEVDGLYAAIAAAFHIRPDKVDPDQGLVAMGLDSVVALDLKARVQRQTGVELTVAELLKGPTPRELAARIEAARGPSVDPDELSDEEVEAMLQNLLRTDT